MSSEVVRDQATHLRELVAVANVTLEVTALKLPDGQGLLDLAGDLKQTLTRSEVVQS